MALPFFNWSRTKANNANADSGVNWAEGQAPSSVNDSARAMMASTAAYRDDTSGGLLTAGTSTAYTLTTYQGFDTLAHLDKQTLSFRLHTTSGAAPTLNIDGLGAISFRIKSLIAPLAGALAGDCIYTGIYNHANTEFLVRDQAPVLFEIPIGGVIPYFGTTVPNSNFVFPYGQAISRTTYSALFALFSTTYGVGDGSTTFNVPDLRGRALVGKDDMGGSSANRLTGLTDGVNGDTLGGTGGLESTTLSLGQLPTGITSSNLSAIGLSVTTVGADVIKGALTAGNSGSPLFGGADHGDIVSTGTIAIGDADVTSNNTGGIAHNNIQPSIVCNYLLRIL